MYNSTFDTLLLRSMFSILLIYLLTNAQIKINSLYNIRNLYHKLTCIVMLIQSISQHLISTGVVPKVFKRVCNYDVFAWCTALCVVHAVVYCVVRGTHCGVLCCVWYTLWCIVLCVVHAVVYCVMCGTRCGVMCCMWYTLWCIVLCVVHTEVYCVAFVYTVQVVP